MLTACGSSGSLVPTPDGGGADVAARIDAAGRTDEAGSGADSGADSGDATISAPGDAGPMGEASVEAGPPSCGTLGTHCCAGGTCTGGLVCANGVCGCASSSDCGGNGTCTSGRCLYTIADDQNDALAIAVNATHVLWANATQFDNSAIVVVPGSVMEAPLDGGAASALVSGVMDYMSGAFAADSTTIYWALNRPGVNAPPPVNAVAATPVAGGPTRLLDGECRGAMAVDATSVYCTSGACCPATVIEVPLGGGTPVTLSSSMQGSPQGIVVHGPSVYWNAGGLLETLPVSGSGGTPSTLASGLTGSDIAANGSAVYWTTSTGIGGLPFSGGSPMTVAIPMNAVQHIAVDDASIYWTDGYDGTVMKAPLAGGTPTTLHQGDVPSAIAVDSTSVYWTSRSGGTVMRLSPK